MKLSSANKPYEKDLKEGDCVIFQQFANIDPDSGVPTVAISVEKITTINMENETVVFKDKTKGSQPIYRIRYVVADGKTYEYPGYDYMAISRDEGQITDETYEKIRKAQSEKGI